MISRLVRSFAVLAALATAHSGPAAQARRAEPDPVAWPDSYPPLSRPWHPHAKMVCWQNPPDFSWPAIAGATAYDLEICRDAEGTDVAHRTHGLARNFHNFAAIFEPGTYYWRVRFHHPGGVSPWSPARRFRIDPDAWPFPVPPVDELLGRIPPAHPRVWVTRDRLAAFRERAKGPRQAWFDAQLARVRVEMATPLPAEPVFPFAPKGPRTREWSAAHHRIREQGWDGYGGAAVRLLRTAFCHLVTGDETIGRHAIAQMLNLCGWDPQGATGYETHDQVHRAIALYSAKAYDWCHDLMSPGERRRVLAMIRTRTLTMVGHLLQRRPINETPFDSHGWTAFGYVGCIAMATLGDIPEAADWFRAMLPAYINVMPPWGGEDGGWAQGLSYWQYSQRSNRELADVLLSATGFDLYGKAFFRRNAYFPLYAFPHGSPRSHFGDGNEYKPANHIIAHLQRFAQLYRDPVLQWAWQAIGDAPVDQHVDYLGGSLHEYFSIDDSLPARPPPPDLPPARWYRDIDWVTLHSDLADPDRVSLYFKSSPYGSFNHSHADQNSFVLNAHGEALAIDGGYYDGYSSPHADRFARQTLAHNAITHDGGLGQPIYDLTAKGRITGFVHDSKFDACTGDATAAYKGALGRAVRHIIFVRPNCFVLIDELAAAPGRQSTFEWWLQAIERLVLDPDQAGATIMQGKAALRVRFAHPGSLSARTETRFIGPPNAYAAGEKPVPVPPVQPRLGDRGTANQIRAVFSTPPAESTIIVTTLQVTRAGETPPPVATHQSDNALELEFAGGAKLGVRLRGTGEVTAAGLTFRGVAAASAGGAILLVNGDRVSRSGVEVLSASLPITAVLGEGRACLSAPDDASVRLVATSGSGWLRSVSRIRDERGRNLPRGTWSTPRDGVQVQLEPGSQTFRFVQDTVQR